MVLGHPLSRARDLLLHTNAKVMNSMVPSEAREIGHIRGREMAVIKMLARSKVVEITKARVVVNMLLVQEMINTNA